MKTITWLLAGVGLGVVAYFVLIQPGPMSADGDEDVEAAAGKTTFWGSKQRVAGTGGRFTGRLKEGLGRVTGDDQLAGEGVVDQIAGTVKDAAGQVAQAAGHTIHDLNY